MKKITQRKINEYNPAAQGAAAARQDDKAAKNPNLPFGYYSEQFYALEEIRMWLIKRSTSTQPFRKAAILIEKAQNAMLKEGR